MRVAQKRHRLHIVALPGTGDDILNIARVVQPHAIPRDADENRAKPVARKLRDDVVCRFKRYIVFGGNAAEDDRNVDHEAPSSAHAARRRTEVAGTSIGVARHRSGVAKATPRRPREREGNTALSGVYGQYHATAGI